MNQPLLLHVVERLEAFVGKLPGAIQKPILHELTPLKELFLQQRPPRLVVIGGNQRPLEDVLRTLFGYPATPESLSEFPLNRWKDISMPDHGALTVLDARGEEYVDVEHELERMQPDAVLLLEENEKSGKASSRDGLQELNHSLERLGRVSSDPVPLFALGDTSPGKRGADSQAKRRGEKSSDLVASLQKSSIRLAGSFRFAELEDERRRREFVTAVARELPNAARIEMARISKDKAVQADIAHILIKSTTAISTAIGAQPIPLADLPVLTTLQLIMVSGIMYVSGRERSLRAATEFVGALGANVGAGMLLREGTRAILKFFPGWGNLVCGAVAGAGTYAIGRAASVFFIEGVSLKDARKTYLASRKKPRRRALGRKRTLELPQTNGETGGDNL